jgi:nucleoside phosphorylase
MVPQSSLWRTTFHDLRAEFQKAAAGGTRLRHLLVRPLGAADELPGPWKRVVGEAEDNVTAEWSPPCPGYLDWDRPETAYLYGPRAELAAYTRLARQAWLAFPGSPDGKAQMAPRHNDTDRWLTVVYRQLRDYPGTYFEADGEKWVAFDPGDGVRLVQAERLPSDPPATVIGRWRITALATDVFAAAALAIDALLARQDDPYAISWQEMDTYQKSPAFQNANFFVDAVILGEGRRFPIYRYWCKAVAGGTPSICPNADPPADEKDRAALLHYLPAIEQRFRGLGLVRDGQTIHWVGRQSSLGTLCRCPPPSEPTIGHQALMLSNAEVSHTPSAQTTSQVMPPTDPSDNLRALLHKADASRQAKLELERRFEEARLSSERFISILNDVRQATPQLLAQRPESVAEAPGDDREQFYPRWAIRFLDLGRELTSAGLQHQLGELEGHVRRASDADAGHYAVNLIRLACHQDREQLERFLRAAGDNPELHGVRMWLHRLADRLVEMRNRIWVESLADAAQQQLQEQAVGSSKAVDSRFEKIQEALDGISDVLPRILESNGGGDATRDAAVDQLVRLGEAVDAAGLAASFTGLASDNEIAQLAIELLRIGHEGTRPELRRLLAEAGQRGQVYQDWLLYWLRKVVNDYLDRGQIAVQPHEAQPADSPHEDPHDALPEYKNEDQPWWGGVPTTKELAADEITGLANEIDLVIMTATEVERDAVLRRLGPLPPRRKIVTGFVGPETYFVGRFGEFNVVVTKCRMGSAGPGSATLAADQAQRIWRPRAIIMVGIAFGKDPTKQRYADVLVASEIIFYEPQRVGANEIVQRGIIPPSNPTLLNRFDNVVGWDFARPDGIRATCRLGPILSGEKLVDDPGFKVSLFRTFPQAIGGEMEGAGLCAAAIRSSVPWILVKAICDWGDGKKHKKHQPLAAAAAVSLVHHVLLQKGVLHGLGKPDQP